MPSWYAATVPTHASYCDYSSPLFSFLPGDPSNPFVVLWQAMLIDAIVLACATLILFLVARLARWPNIKPLGFIYLVAAFLSGLLTLIIVVSSKPQVCNGSSGAPALTAGQQHDLDTFSMLGSLAYVAFYATILLVVAFLIVLLSVPVSRGRHASAR